MQGKTARGEELNFRIYSFPFLNKMSGNLALVALTWRWVAIISLGSLKKQLSGSDGD